MDTSESAPAERSGGAKKSAKAKGQNEEPKEIKGRNAGKQGKIDDVLVTAHLQFGMRYVMQKDDLQKLNTEAEVEPIQRANDTVT